MVHVSWKFKSGSPSLLNMTTWYNKITFDVRLRIIATDDSVNLRDPLSTEPGSS